MTYEGLVYVKPDQNYYARWSRKDRKRTHAYVTEEPLTMHWVEVLRAQPELLDKDEK